MTNNYNYSTIIKLILNQFFFWHTERTIHHRMNREEIEKKIQDLNR